MESYPFLDYINEIDKEKKYKKASECGFYDPYDYFLVRDSGGFLMNIDPTAKFVNTELLQEVGIYFDNNISLDLMYDKPATTFNEELNELYKKNIFRKSYGFVLTEPFLCARISFVFFPNRRYVLCWKSGIITILKCFSAKEAIL